MDTIVIKDLEVQFRVGVPDAERAQPQRLLITLKIEHDFVAAAGADSIGATIDYYAVSRAVLDLGKERSWKLIETLAEDLARLVLDRFGASGVMVEVKKFILPEARYVSVRISRRARFSE